MLKLDPLDFSITVLKTVEYMRAPTMSISDTSMARPPALLGSIRRLFLEEIEAVELNQVESAERPPLSPLQSATLVCGWIKGVPVRASSLAVQVT
jgi:hypothetical protein